MYDILIVGGGPAGLTAAIYARRAGKTVLVLEGTGFGGQIAASHLVENYPAIPSVSGAAYSDALTAQAKALGAETRFGRVSAVRREEERFILTAGKKEFEGRSLILATGAKHRTLGVEREEDLVGRGVSCATEPFSGIRMWPWLEGATAPFRRSSSSPGWSGTSL